MIQAVIFDHDGVLVDTEPIQWRVWSHVLGEHGVKLDAEEWSEQGRGRTTMDTLTYFLGEKYPPEKLIAIAKQKSRMTYEQGKTAPPVPGVQQFIKQLSAAGYLIGVASSGEQNKVTYTIDMLGIGEYLTAVVTAEDITRPKPHPEIFLKTAELLQVSPQYCVVFEDAISGLKAARSAGMGTVLVKTTHAEAEIAPELYDLAITDFTQISVNDLPALGSGK